MSAPKDLASIAALLAEAERCRDPIGPLVDSYPSLTEEAAYEIQRINAARRIRDGQRLVGYKIGLTSREAQRQFGVFKPDFGHLFSTMALQSGGELDLSELIQPKIEGEIAFILGRNLKGPGLTLADILRAVDYAVSALEIVDSRIRDWRIKAVDTIADNGSSARFVLGGMAQRVDGMDWSHVGMALSQNGDVMVTGSGAAVMGNPLAAVVFLANELGEQDQKLSAGDIVLSGALSSMLAMKSGDVFTCEFAGLGGLSLRSVKKGGP